MILIAAFVCGSAASEKSGGENILPARIVHGGGGLWAYDSGGVYRYFAGSNSREGLERCADAGADVVELDFSFTSDGELVCIHNWSAEYIAGISEGEALSLAEFSSSRIYGVFTPLTAADAAEFFRQNPGMILVADIKEDFTRAAAVIAREFGDISDRVVIQIYSREQYDTAADLGVRNIAYSLYRLPWEEKLDAEAHIAFAREHRLAWIAAAAELCENEVFAGKMLESGVPVYVHTVNEKDKEARLLSMGFSGIYTDNIERKTG